MRDYISVNKNRGDIWFPAGLIIAAVLFAMLLTGCTGQKCSEEAVSWEGMEKTGELSLAYATNFSIDEYEQGIRLISIGEDSRFLLVPEELDVPMGVPRDITVLKQPLDRVYLVSSSVMDYIRKLDSISNIRLSGIKEEDWYIQEAAAAMSAGDMLYAGKYNAPDYELILSEGCNLVIENTMIEHNPEVKEKLEEFDIPVLVERSSYEENPLGRLEWIKLYGVLFGKEQEAITYYDNMLEEMAVIMSQENTGKTVAFFYVTGNNAINVRKSKDYIAKLIEMAGGVYAFPELGNDESSLATMNMQQEDFYAGAKDADVLIYNSTITGEITDMEDLLSICPILSDFKAVRNNQVYCTGKNFFQESLSMSTFAVELNHILNGEYSEDMEYIYRLE